MKLNKKPHPDQNNEVGHQQPLKVLVVEDDETNATLLHDLLEMEGMLATVVKRGEEALELLCQQFFNIALIDINLGLGSMDGTELVQKYRHDCHNSNTAGTIMVALTAYAMTGDENRFLEYGFDAYCSKPIFIDELLELIKKLQNDTPPKQV